MWSLLLLFFLSGPSSSAHPFPQELAPPPGAAVSEDTGQVSINANTAADATGLPISAVIFAGVLGPKTCRGRAMVRVDLPPMPPPQSPELSSPKGQYSDFSRMTAAQCYTLPGPGGCGTFAASKADGCEARLFAEPGCIGYVNTAIFVPEAGKAVGGFWRSFEVRCGVPPPDPDTLGKAPLQDLLGGAKMTGKVEGVAGR